MTTEITDDLAPFADLINKIEQDNIQAAADTDIPLHHLIYLNWAVSPNGTLCAIRPYIYTWAIIDGIEATGFSRRWCYGDLLQALTAMAEWGHDKGNAPRNFIRAVL